MVSEENFERFSQVISLWELSDESLHEISSHLAN